MIYIQSENDIKEFIFADKKLSLRDKKVLVVAGDSWTNNLYLDVKERWSYKLGILNGYDYVFNVSTDYGSNEEIFINLLNFLNYNDRFEYTYAKQKNVDNRTPALDRCDFKTMHYLENLDVIIGWSTPIRDKSPISYLYEPFNTSTIPDITDDTNTSNLWKRYFNDWYNVEQHSYKSQLFILFLQEYFRIHNIRWYSFMAFTPLVEKEFENTKWDLRKDINPDNMFGLYGYPTNMQEYLINKQYNTEYNEELPILEMQYMEASDKIELWTGKFKKLLRFNDKFTKRRKFFTDDNHVVFSGDGHPWTHGTTLMAELLSTKIG